MALTFEWDSQKAVANQTKHGVAFDEVTTVFGDVLGWFQEDEAHLAVLFTSRGDELIRIISARRATSRERRKYEEDFR